MAATPIGYDYGSPDLAPSPVGPDDLRKLEATVMWSDDDAALGRAAVALWAQPYAKGEW